MKQIIFRAANKQNYNTNLPPVPSSKAVPDWYKKIPLEDKSLGNYGRLPSTVKKCTPFLDAITSGYTFILPMDIHFSRDESGLRLNWAVERSFGVAEFESRHAGMPTPTGFGSEIVRFLNFPIVTLPKGYSVLVTHPFNRYDLPLLAISAVVDSDSLKQSMTISAYIKEGFVGILEKGTPIAQLLPFKREDWESEYLPAPSELEQEKMTFDLMSVMDRSYMKQYWSKKSYK